MESTSILRGYSIRKLCKESKVWKKQKEKKDHEVPKQSSRRWEAEKRKRELSPAECSIEYTTFRHVRAFLQRVKNPALCAIEILLLAWGMFRDSYKVIRTLSELRVPYSEMKNPFRPVNLQWTARQVCDMINPWLMLPYNGPSKHICTFTKCALTINGNTNEIHLDNDGLNEVNACTRKKIMSIVTIKV